MDDAPHCQTTAACERHLRICSVGHADCVRCLFAAGARSTVSCSFNFRINPADPSAKSNNYPTLQCSSDLELGQHLPGYLGRLRKKSKGLAEASEEYSWKSKCCFLHPVTQKRHSWLMCKPDAWSSEADFSVGCWVCNAAVAKVAFAQLSVSSRSAIQIGNLKAHAQHGCHAKAVELLREVTAETGPQELEAAVAGPVSGLSDKLPRLDRWVQALELVKQRGAYEQFSGLVQSQAVGSSLVPGGDDSPHVARRLIFSMAEVISQRDREILKQAIASSIAIDKTKDWLLLYIRVLVKQGIYDMLGGIQGDTGGDVPAVTAALNSILKRMCTEPKGRRASNGSVYEHEEDRFREDAC